MKYFNVISPIAWLVLTFVCLLLVVIGIRSTLYKTNIPPSRGKGFLFFFVAGLTLWTALLLALSVSGFFTNFNAFPPRVVLVLVLPLPIILAFSSSNSGRFILNSIPAHWLVYFQFFRVPVELLLLFAWLNNRIPVQMTFEGFNFDIISGLLALPVGYFVMKQKKYARIMAIIYNFLGLLLLLNILVIAMLSMPTPLRIFMNEPSNTIVAEFPYILLPGVLVPLAYGLHVISLKKLFAGQTHLSVQHA